MHKRKALVRNGTAGGRKQSLMDVYVWKPSEVASHLLQRCRVLSSAKARVQLICARQAFERIEKVHSAVPANLTHKAGRAAAIDSYLGDLPLYLGGRPGAGNQLISLILQ